MKRILAITLSFAALIMTSSCDDGLEELNENPNSPEFVLTNTIFNYGTKRYTDVTRDDFNMGRLDLNWMEYWGQTAYADEDRYLYRETSSTSLYQNSYFIATEFKTIIDLNVDPETAALVEAVGNNDNQIAASRIMLALVFSDLTNFFGDVPYYSYGSDDPDFEALKVDDIKSPVFASQQKIYVDILKELRESADMINVDEPVFTSGDNIFNGDATKWKKFANSLILRIANRLKAVDAGVANSAIAAAISSGVMTSNDDNAIQLYETSDANSSPFWDAFIARTDFAVAAPFVDLLKGETGNYGPDPRLFEMVAPKAASINSIKAGDYTMSTNLADYQGIPFAFPVTNLLPRTTYSYMSSKVLRPDFGNVLMEYAEVQFLLSEINNFDQIFYENGVRASMLRWGVSSGDADAFVANLPAANLENVITQKYVALYMQAHEAWAEYRRTGFPNTDILLLPGETYTLPADQAAASELTSYEFKAATGSTDLPFRIRYPQTLQTLNGDNLSDAVGSLPNGDTILSKLFWDVN